jgi:hypothetical protein
MKLFEDAILTASYLIQIGHFLEVLVSDVLPAFLVNFLSQLLLNFKIGAKFCHCKSDGRTRSVRAGEEEDESEGIEFFDEST